MSCNKEIKSPRLLVLVHPGSTCGSADFHHGRQMATEERHHLADFIRRWEGHLVVLDNDLSDEISSYPLLQSAIEHSQTTNKNKGYHVARLEAGDDDERDWVKTATHHIAALEISRATLTGAWYHEDDDGGCVNAMYDALDSIGIAVDVDDSVLPIDIE